METGFQTDNRFQGVLAEVAGCQGPRKGIELRPNTHCHRPARSDQAPGRARDRPRERDMGDRIVASNDFHHRGDTVRALFRAMILSRHYCIRHMVMYFASIGAPGRPSDALCGLPSVDRLSALLISIMGRERSDFDRKHRQRRRNYGAIVCHARSARQ